MPIRCAQCLVIFTAFIMISSSIVSIAGAAYALNNEFLKNCAHINLNISVPIFIFGIISLLVSVMGVFGGFTKNKFSIYAFAATTISVVIAFTVVTIYTSVTIESKQLCITNSSSLPATGYQIQKLYNKAAESYILGECDGYRNYPECAEE